MQETFEILKRQMAILEEMAKENIEPGLQLGISAAMGQIATVMTDIAKNILYLD